MSSYGSEAGAWDGGPPGAEAEYATQRAPPTVAPLPTTDPWTGVSYSHYGPPQYDYQAYGAHTYGYNYDSSYYQTSDGTYYDTRSTYPPQHTSYDYQKQQERPRSPYESRSYEATRRPYRSKARSVSPYPKREREYSRKRESSYDSRRCRSRSRSLKSKRTKYSSSRSSRSRSQSYSRLSKKDDKRRRSLSSASLSSNTSYKKGVASRENNSLTPPLRKKYSHANKHSKTPESERRSRSLTPKYKEKLSSKSKTKHHSNKDLKVKEKRQKESCTPPRKPRNVTPESPRTYKKSRRSPATPPKRCLTPPRKQKYKSQGSESASKTTKKVRDSSVTPPRCYARESSHSSRSRSRSRSPTSKTKRNRSRTPKKPRRSSSSHSPASLKHVRTKSKRRTKRKESREKSRSKSRSKKRPNSKSRSRSRKRSKSPRKSVARSRSREKSRSGGRSRSGSPSEDERRGQFTVADRKRFWKLHRTMQEKKESAKSPPKELKAPPGAVESTNVDDIEYGDPPEVEGPNFAELLPTVDQYTPQLPSTSKSKAIPIPIKNDGSFLEMFKKMQEETKKTEVVEKKPEIKKPALPFIGKRRGGRVLKTGLVKKAKAIDEQAVDNTPKDAWSLYMQEVKKYRETSCEEERKTRPLVK